MTTKSPITNIAQHLHVSKASCLSLYISSTSRQAKDAHGLSALNFDFANTREERDCGVDGFNISKRIILSYRYSNREMEGLWYCVRWSIWSILETTYAWEIAGASTSDRGVGIQLTYSLFATNLLVSPHRKWTYKASTDSWNSRAYRYFMP